MAIGKLPNIESPNPHHGKITDIELTSLKSPKPLNSHHKPTDSISDDGKHRGRNRRKDSNTCVKCLRGTLTCYNVILVLIGVGGLAAGVWLMLKDFSASEVSALLGVDMFEISAYLLIAGGGVVALLAFCGCCGTMKEDKCVLGFYATTLTLMLLLLVGGAVVAFIARDYLEIRLQDNFKKTLQTKYGVDVRTNSENRLITDAWDSVQRELECCGVHGGVMSTTSWSFYKSQSEWYRLKKEKTPLVPESCCKPDGNRQLCTGDQFKGPPIHAVDESLGRKENPHLYSNGCFDKVLENIQEHSLLIGLVSACIPIFLIVGVVVSCCLCFKVEKDPDDDDDSDFYGGRPV